MKKNKLIQLFSVVIIAMMPLLTMAQEAPEKPTLSLGLKYYNDNNKTHHLLAEAKSKIDGKFQKISNINVSFYISNDSSKENLIGTGTTNAKGEAALIISDKAKSEWLKSPNQNFIVVSKPTRIYEETRGELAITKAKIAIDTAEGRIINAKLMALVDTTWTPIAGVDMIVGVKRLSGSILNANETPTYSTDSSGGVMAEFKRDSLPGDTKGNIILIASVVDNDMYGNLTTEMAVPWGKYYPYESNFDERTLFARRGHSPLWLEFLAYAIVIVVWSVIIYLFFQIKKIKQLGLE
jgi:hypothetical protein